MRYARVGCHAAIAWRRGRSSSRRRPTRGSREIEMGARILRPIYAGGLARRGCRSC